MNLRDKFKIIDPSANNRGFENGTELTIVKIWSGIDVAEVEGIARYQNYTKCSHIKLTEIEELIKNGGTM